jgi:site-specific recombinase XerD
MLAENSGRANSSNIDSPTLDWTSVDAHFEIDDSEDDDSGGVIVHLAPWLRDGSRSRQPPTGQNGCVPCGRRNDIGDEMVLDLCRQLGMSEYVEWFTGSVAPSTLRNYRRGFSLFFKLLSKADLTLAVIRDSVSALAALIRTIKIAFDDKVTASAVSTMRTAMVRLFAFLFNEDLSQSAILKMAMRYYVLNNLPRKEMLRLQWSVDQLFDHLMKLPSFSVMTFDQLTETSIVLCIAFSTLRFTELEALDMCETAPDEAQGVWKLWAHVKGHDYKEPILLHKVDVDALDPVRALSELKSRISVFQSENDPPSRTFWHKQVGKKLIKLSYNEIRAAAVRVLAAAGIQEKRPYHIKHAVLTCLDKNGASAKDIASFARHRFGSMSAYQHYVSYDGGASSVKKLISHL